MADSDGNYVKGHLARDSKKAGGEVRFFRNKPKLDKETGTWIGREEYGDSKLLEQPLFRMNPASYEEAYGEKSPGVGKCVTAELELE